MEFFFSKQGMSLQILVLFSTENIFSKMLQKLRHHKITKTFKDTIKVIDGWFCDLLLNLQS